MFKSGLAFAKLIIILLISIFSLPAIADENKVYVKKTNQYVESSSVDWQSAPLLECAEQCANDNNCHFFVYSANATCKKYTKASISSLKPSNGYDAYVKMQEGTTAGFSTLSNSRCGTEGHKACHCKPELYACGLWLCKDCSPHDSCQPKCTVVGSSSLNIWHNWTHEATCQWCDGVNRSGWAKTPLSNDRGNCGGINCWKHDDTVRDHLNMITADINFITDLKSQGLPVDGRYIYVYRKTDDRILVRPYDRLHNDLPNETNPWIYPGNCNPNIRFSQTRCTTATGQHGGYMHVRHSQLNGGWDPVWCAGEMLIESGKISVANNESGHFKPNATCLDYVRQTLDAWGVPVAQNAKFGDYTQYPARMPPNTR